MNFRTVNVGLLFCYCVIILFFRSFFFTPFFQEKIVFFTRSSLLLLLVFFLEFSRAHRSFHGVQLLLCGQQGVGRQKDVCVCNLNCQLDVNVD